MLCRVRDQFGHDQAEPMTLCHRQCALLDRRLAANARRLQNCLRQSFAETLKEVRNGNCLDIPPSDRS